MYLRRYSALRGRLPLQPIYTLKNCKSFYPWYKKPTRKAPICMANPCGLHNGVVWQTCFSCPTERRFQYQYLGTCFLNHIWSIQEYLLHILLHQKQRYPSIYFFTPYVFQRFIGISHFMCYFNVCRPQSFSHFSAQPYFPCYILLVKETWWKGDANKATAQPSLTCM